MSQPVGKKFKLRRIKPVQQDAIESVIQENLKPLKENIQKKKRAQEAYYENHNDISPLIRDSRRRPVHQRLGRRIPFNGTNTSAIPPKRRLRRPDGGLVNQPYLKRNRVFTAQQRLNRIRANQREVLNSQTSFTPKRIKLRRTLPQQLGAPANLMVQVKNNGFINRPPQTQHRFKQILKPQLQQEIKKIQMEYQGQGNQIIAPMRVTPSSTSLTMHQRFARLS